MTRNAEEMIGRTSYKPELLQFTHDLVVYELAFDLLAKADFEVSSEPDPPAAFLVCEKLRHPLTRLAGVDGFRFLVMRALTLAKARASGVSLRQLNSLQVKPDGSLDHGDRLPISEHARNENDAVVILTVELLALLVAFVGEDFTLSLVSDVWPGFPVLETELWRKSNRDQPE